MCDQKRFQICKFFKLLAARDRVTWQSGQRSGINVWLKYLVFQIRIVRIQAGQIVPQ